VPLLQLDLLLKMNISLNVYEWVKIVFSTRKIVDNFIRGGNTNTANLCSIDLPKAFDKVNYHGLYLKLMKRRIPVELLLVFENWFSGCSACVKWNEAWSAKFTVSFGVRQNLVLSPFLFNIYLDDIARINDCTKQKFIIIFIFSHHKSSTVQYKKNLN